jgi:RecA/RadA recombinase
VKKKTIKGSKHMSDEQQESNVIDETTPTVAIEPSPPAVPVVDEYADVDIEAIIAKQHKEFNAMMGKLENFVVKASETPILHTGIPTLDICLGGGIPSKRMSYFWGTSGTGKTTLCFEIAYHNFLRLAYSGKANDWRFVFLDAEEGESKKWLQRIGINLPYKYDVPTSIEDIEQYLESLKKEFPGQELCVIWDSVSATSPKSITGRADISRAVSSLLNHIKLTDLDITFLVINQHREKQDQYAPPLPPGGNFLRHKSHLTMHAPSVAKSDFWKDKKNGRSILWKTQKTRDSFNDVELRLEMTYFSGFDAVLSMISTMNKDLKMLKKRVDSFTLSIDEDLAFKTGEKEAKQEFEVAYKDIADFALPEEKKIEGFQDLYNFLLTPESMPYWKFALRYYAYQVFRPYFVVNVNQFTPFFEALVQNMEEYYFKNWNLFEKTIPTKIKF